MTYVNVDWLHVYKLMKENQKQSKTVNLFPGNNLKLSWHISV